SRRRRGDGEARANDHPRSGRSPRRDHDASAGLTTVPERMFCAMTLAGIPTAAARVRPIEAIVSTYTMSPEVEPSPVDESMGSAAYSLLPEPPPGAAPAAS